MAHTGIDSLTIASPYEEPKEHWSYDRQQQQFYRVPGRRPAGYLTAGRHSKAFDDPGEFVEIPLVNRIRERVKKWRHQKYPGVSGISRRLLDHWQDPEEFDSRRFFYCQLEAAETLIWLTEGPPSDHVGLDIPADMDSFKRLCAKMATGTGKTVVMAMVIAWHILNKVAQPNDRRFSKNILIVAPGLTVRNRLAVLQPTHEENYYDLFHVVPPTLREKLNQGKIVIRNWHALNWQSEEQISKKRSVDKRGPLSDQAYVRTVLGDMARARNILVINDEAHHAWRVTQSGARGIKKADIDTATKWVGGLDRIHRTRSISVCYDFSATPFAPTGKRSTGESLFGWIVSDFGLNDSIEAGLVKTPRVVIRDDAVLDAENYKSRFYHLYNDADVKGDLARKSPPDYLLPDLVSKAYYLLGYDWRETFTCWKDNGHDIPPVMITVANRTETAARIKHTFDKRLIDIPELCDPNTTLHIDSRVLNQAEAEVSSLTPDEDGFKGRLSKKQRVAERLRLQVDTVGKRGKAGEQIRNVISVGMLSEGWDAKSVTHIMGLRAFSSQLLCEQVVGRGLRRMSYDLSPDTGLLEPEYVNIFGIPFTFLPHEKTSSTPPPPDPKTAIEALEERRQFEISWPNVLRVNVEYRPQLTLDFADVEPLTLDAAETPSSADLAPILASKPDERQLKKIDLETLARETRMQSIIFDAARHVYFQMEKNWTGGDVALIGQLVRLTEDFIRSSKIGIVPSIKRDAASHRLVLKLNMAKIVRHFWSAIRHQNLDALSPIYDTDRPILRTGDMPTWYTGRPCGRTSKSHINFCVYDSTWESSDAQALDRSPLVKAWAKNDHLGFKVAYLHRGVHRSYRPDFLVKLASGDMLVLETKGDYNDEAKAKHKHLEEWVQAVNEGGSFGTWHCAVADSPGKVNQILEELCPNG